MEDKKMHLLKKIEHVSSNMDFSKTFAIGYGFVECFQV
jgi:hypothetical protein